MPVPVPVPALAFVAGRCPLLLIEEIPDTGNAERDDYDSDQDGPAVAVAQADQADVVRTSRVDRRNYV